MSTRDPYVELEEHVIDIKALMCVKGCLRVQVSGCAYYEDAAREMAALGWRVRRVRGVLTALCPDCVRSHDEAGEE